MCCILLVVIINPVNAAEFTAPEVPAQAEKYFPESRSTFVGDFWQIFKNVIADIRPEIADAAGICLRVISIILIGTFIRENTGCVRKTINLVQVVGISVILFESSRSMLLLGIETVKEILEYNKLFTPVMTGALAAQGGITSSTGLYIGTMVFNAVLGSVMNHFLVPMLYAYIAVCIAGCAVGENLLNHIKNFLKWLMSWTLKIIIYIFTGYMSITSVVSSSADAAAIKATKLTISGVVPIVGNVISDASDAVLGSAAVIKNSAGVYGLLAVSAIFLAPFLRVGVHYLLLKLTAALCAMFDQNTGIALVDNYGVVMGYVLAMIGLACLLSLISTVCFMKGVQ